MRRIKKLNRIISISLFVLALLYSDQVFAQKGQYLNPYGLYNYTGINNNRDYIGAGLQMDFVNTYHFSYGLQYVNNMTDIFGIETGIKYSTSGQKYVGMIGYDANTQITQDINYTSEVNLTFIQVPFLFRFNSILEEDNVFLTISAGFEADYLTKADLLIDPFPVVSVGVEYKDLFTTFNISFVSNAVFSFKVSENFFINSGFLMARTLGDIENKDFPFDKTIHPVEYYFPVSTKKEVRPDVTIRKATKIIQYGFLLGISYRIKS